MPDNSQVPPIILEPKSKKKVWIIYGFLGAVVVIALAVYFILPKFGQDIIEKTAENIYKPAAASASKFATYKEVSVNINSKVPAYSFKPDLSNIANASDFTFSEAAKNLLVKNAFVVKPSYHNEFFPAL